jgi:hypothetical protein
VIEQQFGIEILPIWHDDLRHDEAKYISDVRSALAEILRSRTGQCLAASLRYHVTHLAAKPITIMPYEGNDFNAEEDTDVLGDSQTSLKSTVLFTAATLKGGCPNCGTAATLPHEILVHELVHSLRRVSGHPQKHMLAKNSALEHYTTDEEFLAILVTNIFISDITNHHKTGLRNNHEGHLPLDPELVGSFRFFLLGTKAFNIIAKFCEENSGFTRMLAGVMARFNPVAAYYKNRHRAFEMAANGDAEHVFGELHPLVYARWPDGLWRRIIDFNPSSMALPR